MSAKEKIGISLFIASLGTIFDVLYRKIGGHASGGRFSHPHTWTELKEFVPEFIGLFCITFIGMAIYQFVGKETDAICPKCEESFTTSNIKNAICPRCGTVAERLKGFYERNRNLLKKKTNITKRCKGQASIAVFRGPALLSKTQVIPSWLL